MSGKLPVSLAGNPRLDRWIAIEASDKVTIATGKVELGQGSVTAIAGIAGAELGLRLDQLTVIAGDTRLTPDEGFTAGSLSIEHGGAAMRWAAAQVRTLFAEAAAAALNTSPDMLTLEDGVFSEPGRNESRSYWDLREAVDLARSAQDLPAPAFRGGSLDGPNLRRLDLRQKLTGAGFIQDMTRPDLLYGRVLRPPNPGARLDTLDAGALRRLPGVKTVLVDGSFIAIAAERDAQARAAILRAEMLARWSGMTAFPPTEDANAWMGSAEGEDTVVHLQEPSPSGATRRHSAHYSRPYIAHASIGPSCALAEWQGETLTVWSHTQGVFPLRRELAKALRVPLENVVVSHRPGSGCYGHNGADDVALDAALLARAAGAPVLVQWSRREEMANGPFGAAMRVRLDADLDATGRIVAWRHEIWSPPHVARPRDGEGVSLLAEAYRADPVTRPKPAHMPLPSGAGERNAVPLYEVGARTIVHHMLPQGAVRTSALRSLGAHANVFAIESFLDELAALAGRDPLQFRLDHLSDPRARHVLERAAEAAGWRPGVPGGDGRGRGLAFARYKNIGGYCAIVATVEVDEKVRLTEAVAAVDCGALAYRDGVVNQVEGGIIQAASWTLKEQVRWRDGAIATRSWEDYPILGFDEVPRIEVVIVDRPDDPTLGAGECAAGPIAGAIGNAVAHALGLRIRDMPLTPDRIIAAMEG